MKHISNEEIYSKLLDIERILKKRLERKSFTDITEWKKYIWDNCPHKKQRMNKNEIDFYCDVLNNSCEFEDCPRNLIE